MSLTIADLTYQNTGIALHRYMRDTFSWLYGMTVVDGVLGKTTMSDIDIDGNLLVAASCIESNRNTEMFSKEIELDYYNLSFPIKLCDLKQTWLSGFANKYRDEKEVYIENLVPFLAEKIGDEIRTKVNTDIRTEALADANVSKVALSGNISTPALAYGTLIEFIEGLPSSFINLALDKDNYEGYGIYISPEAYKQIAIHLSDKVSSYGINVGGFNVVGDKTLSGNSMLAKSYRNGLVVFDDSADLAKIKVINEEWISTSYIVTGLAFKGSYVDSSKIVISN